jgi:hypothetical protein
MSIRVDSQEKKKRIMYLLMLLHYEIFIFIQFGNHKN